MATLDQIEAALRAADAAGDKEAAAQLAAEYRAMQSTQPTLTAAPPQIGGFVRAPLMVGSELVRGLAGALGAPGDIQSLAASGLTRLGVSPANAASMTSLPLIDHAPTSADLLALTGRAGITDRADLIPGWGDLPGERYLASGAQAIGSTLPMLALGPEEGLLPTAAAAAGGGLGSELARDVKPDSSLAPLAVGALTGAGIGGLAQTGVRAANALTGNLGPGGELFAAAGLPMRSPALTTERAGTASLLAPYVPREQTLADVGGGIESHASALGPQRTLQSAGETVQDEARHWLINVMPKKEDAVWGPVDKAIPANTQTPVFNFYRALQGMNSDAGSMQELVNQVRPQLPKKLQQIMDDVLGSPAGTKGTPDVITKSTILDPKTGQPIVSVTPGTPPQPVVWADVRKLRTALGDAMNQPKIASDIGQDNLKQLYAAVTDDLRGAARGVDSVNPQANATKLFDAANLESTRLNNFAENVVGKAVTTKNKAAESIAPEVAAKRFLAPAGKGGTPLAALRSEMPDAADALGAVHLRALGLEDPNDAGATMAGKFPARWQSLSPEAKTALYPDPMMRASLDAQARIGEMAQRAGKPGGLGHGLETLVGGGYGTALGEIANYAYHHLMGEPLGAGSEIASGAIGDIAGMLAPALYRGAAARLANSPLAARYAASASPDYLLGSPWLDLPIAATAGAAPNALVPEKRGNK